MAAILFQPFGNRTNLCDFQRIYTGLDPLYERVTKSIFFYTKWSSLAEIQFMVWFLNDYNKMANNSKTVQKFVLKSNGSSIQSSFENRTNGLFSDTICVRFSNGKIGYLVFNYWKTGPVFRPYHKGKAN
jgi:hypothetical protein